MGEYGSGISFGQACNLDKERIKHALDGELMVGEDENGNFVYEKASPEECRKYILTAYDNVVYLAEQANMAWRAMERLYQEETGKRIGENFRKYMELREAESQRFRDYKYEADLDS